MTDPHLTTLTGEFVNLRPLTPADAEITFRWRHSQRAIFLNRPPASVEAQAAWIANRPATEYNFIIETKSQKPIGMLSLLDVDLFHKRAEPGRFLIGDEEAVKGIPAAVEAMKLLYELAFDRLSLRRVYGSVLTRNTRMLKWQLFMGMVKEGIQREHCFIDGKYQDSIMLAMMEDEYRQTALPRLRAMILAGRTHTA